MIKQHTLLTLCAKENVSHFGEAKSTKFVAEWTLHMEITQENSKELNHPGNICQILWSFTKEQLASCLTKLLIFNIDKEGMWELNVAQK